MTRRNLSGRQANSSTLCDRPKPASTDSKDQPFTEVPPGHDPARPKGNQLGSSDSENIGTGEAAESPEHTHIPAGNYFEWNNAVAGPGIDQYNGDFVTTSGPTATSNNDGVRGITVVYNNPVKTGPGSQHNGLTFELGEGGTLKNLPTVIYNNPTFWAGPSFDEDKPKTVGIQHNGHVYKSRSAPVKDQSEPASS